MYKEVQEFGEFADTTFNNHVLELHTQYKNSNLSSAGIITEAYNIHRKIFDNELNQKISSLVSDKDPWLKEKLIAIKKKYEENLIWNKPTKTTNNN